jgi:methylmalonyl-CoA/ethylmalonyl-CoA epimerase
MIKRINHIGIAVKSIEAQSPYYKDILGFNYEGEETVESQGVRVAFFRIADVRIELLQPLSDASPVAKFIEKRGEGIHHIAFETDDLEERINFYVKKGIRMIDQKPRKGAHNMDIAFLHPKSTGGVLTELCQNSESCSDMSIQKEEG